MKRYTFRVNGRTYDIHASSYRLAEVKLDALLRQLPSYP